MAADEGASMMRENRVYDEISVGDHATVKRVLTPNDLYIFANASGNLNPLHMPKSGDENLPEVAAPSMWAGTSDLVGTREHTSPGREPSTSRRA